MNILQGATALITGSDSGIGKAIAIEFAKEGAQVVITYNSNEKSANEVLEEIRKAGGSAVVYQLNVSDEKHVSEVFAGVLEKFGQLSMRRGQTVGLAMNGADSPDAGWCAQCREDALLRRHALRFAFLVKESVGAASRHAAPVTLSGVEQLFQFLRGEFGFNPFDGGKFAGQTLEGRFVDLPFAVGLVGLIGVAVQIAHHFRDGDGIA